MSYSDKKLIPNQAIIYEQADGIVYARYRDPPHNDIPRWIVGGDPFKVNRFDPTLWKDIIKKSENHPALEEQVNKILNLYYLLKDDEKN